MLRAIISTTRIGGAAVLAAWLGVACGGQSSDLEQVGTAISDCGDEPGTICPWAGTGAPGFDGDGNRLAESRFYWPMDLTFTSTGDAYILDWNNHRVRVVTDDDTLKTVIGSDFVGDGPEDLSDLERPGADGTRVLLNHPTQILEADPETMWLIAWHNHKIREYDVNTGKVVVICGRGAGFDGDGSVSEARLNQPSAARFDEAGNLYILDQRNQRIRRIDEFNEEGTIETVVGTGEQGFAGDGGPPLEAQVSFPTGSNPPPAGSLTFDEQGRLYFADTLNNRVRRVDFENDEIDTVLGDGDEDTLHNPRDVELGPGGRIYVADELNHRVLALDPESLEVTTIAGTGKAGDSGDAGPADEAKLNRPAGLAFDEQGNLYIADSYNHRIRVVKGLDE